MIEQSIKNLRKAAQVSTSKSSDKVWCAIAGNEEAINEVIYEARTMSDHVEILHREHSSFKDDYIEKKFDFIMLYGESDNIRDLSNLSKEDGCAYIQVAPFYTEHEKNLMLFVGEEDHVHDFFNDLEKNHIEIKIILEDKTTGFIETDVVFAINLPKIIKDIIDPLFKMTDIILSTLLISADEKDEPRLKKLANKNKIYSIKFNDMMEE